MGRGTRVMRITFIEQLPELYLGLKEKGKIKMYEAEKEKEIINQAADSCERVGNMMVDSGVELMERVRMDIASNPLSDEDIQRYDEEKKKEEKEKLEELTKRLYQWTPKSWEFADIQREIANQLEKQEKYQTPILVYPSLIHDPSLQSDIAYNSKSPDFIHPLLIERGVTELRPDVDQHDTPVFRSSRTFVEDSLFRFEPRYAMEYNPHFKQVVVATYITDGKNMILLKSTDATRIQNKITFIQGHVDFSPDVYLQTQVQVMKNAVIRELTEEIKPKDNSRIVSELASKVPNMPRFVVNTAFNHIDIEHIGFVYEIVVPNVQTVYDQIVSGEEGNHSVVMVPITWFVRDHGLDMHYQDSKYPRWLSNADNWVRAVIETQYDL